MIKFPIVKNEEFPEIADVYMSDATQPTKSTEGKVLGPAAPSTEADRSGSAAAPGMGEAKRRRITPQSNLHDLFTNTLDFLSQIIDIESGYMNCLSSEHTTENCPSEGAEEWRNLLIGVRDGMETRNPATSSADVVVDLVEEDQQEHKSEIISFHKETKPLQEIVGEDDIKCTNVGGKDPRKLGFRRQDKLYELIDQHIPQRGHVSNVDQDGMNKYRNSTEQVRYGKIRPLRAEMAVFTDPAWGDCKFDRNALHNNDNHSAVRNYTRRWTKVLRHDIGHAGRAASCDELGWVSVEEFIRNDHAWPINDKMAYNKYIHRAI